MGELNNHRGVRIWFVFFILRFCSITQFSRVNSTRLLKHVIVIPACLCRVLVSSWSLIPCWSTVGLWSDRRLYSLESRLIFGSQVTAVLNLPSADCMQMVTSFKGLSTNPWLNPLKTEGRQVSLSVLFFHRRKHQTKAKCLQGFLYLYALKDY